MQQQIALSLGATEYTWPLTITDVNGKDISAATIELSLGSSIAPGTWSTPDVDPAQTVKSQRVVQLLVGGSFKPPAGSYWLWSRVTDTPEIAPRRQIQILID